MQTICVVSYIWSRGDIGYFKTKAKMIRFKIALASYIKIVGLVSITNHQMDYPGSNEYIVDHGAAPK